MYRKQLLARIMIGAVAGCLIWVPSAGAVTVDVTLSESGFATFDAGAPGAFVLSYGTFNTITVGGTYLGPPGISFDGTNVSSSSNGTPGILTVSVIASGITSPLSAALPLLAELQSNGVPNGWTVTEKVLLNGVLIPGFTSSFTGSGGTIFDTGTVNVASGPYSITEQFIISANATNGSTTNNIELSSTPLPGALSLFAGGLGVVGLLARRRKRKGGNALSAIA